MASDAISKMDPMLRKLENDVAAVKDALKNEDMIAAQQLLRSINQTSDFLADNDGTIAMQLEQITEVYHSGNTGLDLPDAEDQVQVIFQIARGSKPKRNANYIDDDAPN